MRKLSSFLAALVLVHSLSLSAGTASGQVPALTFSLHGRSLEITPPLAHHFNAEAPAELRAEKTILQFKLLAAKLTATVPLNAAGKYIDVLVYVCDDAKTFCLKKPQTYQLPGILSKDPAAPTAADPTAPAPRHAPKSAEALSTKPQGSIDPETDFIVNDPKKAFRLATSRNLPLMIDFFGIWCPPCNHLDAVVFKSAKFRSRNAKRFVKLKIDTDQERFNDLKNRYKIQALPTVIFTTSSGDEIFRLLGFHPLDELLNKADAAYAGRDVGFAELAGRADGVNAEAQFKAARIALDRDEPEKALNWLKPLEELFTQTHDPRLAQLYRAQLGVAQLKTDSAEAKRVLRQWIKDFPDSVEQIENYQTLAALEEKGGNQAANKAALTEAASLVEKLMAQPTQSLIGSYYTPADLAETRADLYDQLGDPEKAKTAYLICSEAYSNEAVAEGKGFARGPNLEKAYCLGKAGKTRESEAIYREGIRRYPNEYTFHQGLAKLYLMGTLNTGKDPKKALEEAENALKFAYGNQRLKAALTKVKAQEAFGDVQGGIATLDEVLNAPLAEHPSPSTLKLRKTLEAKKAELQKHVMGS